MTSEEIQMIDDVIKRNSKLTDWEIGFIDSLLFRNSLTQKQVEKLEAIWERITS